MTIVTGDECRDLTDLGEESFFARLVEEMFDEEVATVLVLHPAALNKFLVAAIASTVLGCWAMTVFYPCKDASEAKRDGECWLHNAEDEWTDRKH